MVPAAIIHGFFVLFDQKVAIPPTNVTTVPKLLKGACTFSDKDCDKDFANFAVASVTYSTALI